MTDSQSLPCRPTPSGRGGSADHLNRLTTIRSPINYYGGKQNMAKTITAMIPEHKVYVEPFCGGAAVFWDKKKSDVEVLCDLDFDLINFYKCIKYYQTELSCMINNIEYNKKTLRNAFNLLRYPFNPDTINIMRAALYWYCQNGSFNAAFTPGDPIDAYNKREWINQTHKDRLQDVHIYCANAFDIISAYDSPDTLFYVDPPYFNSHQNYFVNFSASDYKKILCVLANIRGKFILSGYPSHLLKNYSKIFKWKTEHKVMRLTSALANGNIRNKVEELTWNF